MIKSINGATFRRMILSGAKLLNANKEYVDSLNVFPGSGWRHRNKYVADNGVGGA